MKILIFDPDAEARAFLKKILAQHEYEVLETAEADDVVERLKASEDEPVRILIAAFDQPEMDGMELINHLLAGDLEIYPYIIFVADEARRKNVIDSLGPIPGDFVLSPVVEEDLLSRMTIAERTIALQTSLKQGQGHSESLALYDQLTSVLNRQAVYERALAELNRAQREGIQLSVGMLEVLNLPEIRSEHGPEIRDQAIRFVARAARANVRIYDIVGRWIGSKFLLMLPGASAENARAVLERIAKAVTTIRIRTPEGGRLQLDIRCGFTNSQREDPQPLYVLIEQANQALESAHAESDEKVVGYEVKE
ncbi:MAG: diguanylate cyclase [Chloroflexi bacterium]|nr:diguanylate cyclase [Chloroflexota bacterium]